VRIDPPVSHQTDLHEQQLEHLEGATADELDESNMPSLFAEHSSSARSLADAPAEVAEETTMGLTLEGLYTPLGRDPCIGNPGRPPLRAEAAVPLVPLASMAERYLVPLGLFAMAAAAVVLKMIWR